MIFEASPPTQPGPDDDLGPSGDPVERDEQHRIQDADRFDALAQLAGGVAHHVNNKLTAILGHAELARSELREGSTARDDLDTIRALSQELADLAHQLLGVAGRGGVSFRPVDLDGVVRENEHHLRTALPDGVGLAFELNGGATPVAGDAGQLSDALQYLVRHAAERSVGGGTVAERTVVVRTRRVVVDADHPVVVMVDRELAPGPYVALEVVAPGPLPEPSVVAGWFEPFASGLTVDEGLHLPAVLGIARGHRGGMQVVAEPGAGTTYTVLLPSAAPLGPT